MTAIKYLHPFHIDDIRQISKWVTPWWKIWEWRVYYTIDGRQDYTFHERRPTLGDFIRRVELAGWVFYIRPTELSTCKSGQVVRKREWGRFQDALRDAGKPAEVISVVNVDIGFGELERVLTSITNTLQKEIEVLPRVIESSTKMIGNLVIRSVENITETVEKGMRSIYAFFSDAIRSTISIIDENLRRFYNAISNTIGGSIKTLSMIVSNIYGQLLNITKSLISEIVDSISMLYNVLNISLRVIAEQLYEIPKQIKSLIENFRLYLDKLIDGITNLMQSLLDLLRELFEFDIDDLIKFQKEYAKKIMTLQISG